MQIRYYLDKKHANQAGEAPIFMSVSYEGKRFIMATRQKIKPENWSIKDSRAIEPDLRGEVTEVDLEPKRLNSLLERLASTVKNIYSQEQDRMLEQDKRISEIPTSFIREKLKAPTSMDVFTLIEKFLKHKKKGIAEGTVRVYNNWEKSLMRYNDESEKLTFSSFDGSFPDKYAEYCWSIGNKNGVIKERLSKTKEFVRWAVNRDYVTNPGLDGWDVNLKTKGDKENLLYLTLDELEKIYNADLSDEHVDMPPVRDMLIFNCFFGARYEDVQGIEKDNIKTRKDGSRYIRFWVKKKKKFHEVDLNDHSEEVVRKYENEPGEKLFPRMITSRYNQHLKKLGEAAEINSIETKLDYSEGSEPDRIEKEKHQLMSSHIGRKTFTTLGKYLGLSLEVVASITDHDSRAIEAYYKILPETQRKAMNKMNTLKFNAKQAEKIDFLRPSNHSPCRTS